MELFFLSVFPLMSGKKEVGVVYSFVCLHFLFCLKRVKEISRHNGAC